MAKETSGTGTGESGNSVVTPPASPASATSAWDTRIKTYATAVGKDSAVITTALTELVGEASDDALGILSDPMSVTDVDLEGALVKAKPPGIPLGVFRKNLALLRGPQTKVAEPTATEGANTSFDVLPKVPDDISFLEPLKVGGEVKVDTLTIMSAMKAALAHCVGLFELPATIMEEMEVFSKKQDEPVGRQFFVLQKLVTSRSYGDLFAVLEIPGTFVTERRKKEFLAGFNDDFWAPLRNFNTVLSKWYKTWSDGVSGPGAFVMMMAGNNNAHGVMPTGMTAAPPTLVIRNEAEAVANKINHVFAGTGVLVARALAYDATRIKKVLEEPTLPAAIGATNKDQMLKQLGVTVGSDWVQLEKSITCYVAAIIGLKDVAPGNPELIYLNALVQLSSQIPWDRIPDMFNTPSGIVRPSIGIGGGRGSRGNSRGGSSTIDDRDEETADRGNR